MSENKLIFLGTILGTALGLVLIAHAQTSAITFPIPELGNCSSKDDCRNYCNDPSHMDACIKFAQAHGLMNKDESSRAEKFREAIANGGGPGGCNSPQSCSQFCSNINNLEICLKFAEEHGLKDKNIEQAIKVRDYIKSGGQLPGGCNSEASCRNHCSDFTHGKECFEFAKKIGAAGKEDLGAAPEQIQKFIDLAARGETPGGCKTKDECESYCKDSSHFNECLVFAQKAGFISHDQAEMVRKTGGKGPGGCDSEASCRDYCNNPVNREGCFKFAEAHGLISPDKLKEAREGMTKIQQGLNQAPPEVAQCLRAVLGPNIIEDIQAGKLVPGPEIGDRVKECFEKFRESFQQRFQQEQQERQERFQEKFREFREGVPERVMPPQGIKPPEGFRGPGGCTSEEECRRYCSDPAHSQECGRFGAPPPQQFQPEQIPPPQFQPPNL